MRGFFKACGIIISVLLVVGMIFLAIGIATGGFSNTMEKILSGDIGIIKFFTKKGEDKNFNKNYPILKDYTGTETYDIGNADTISLDLGGVSMETKKSASGECKVELTSIRKYQGYVEDGTLYIKAIDTKVGGGSSKIVLYLPEGKEWESMDLDIGAGTFTSDGFTCKDLKLDAGAGTVKISGLNCGNLDCDLGAGSIKLTDAVVTGDIKWDAGAGESIFTGKVGGSIKANCAAGAMKITLRGTTEEEHNYKLTCAAGSLKVGGKNISGLGGEEKTDNGADNTYDITVAAGSCQVIFE